MVLKIPKSIKTEHLELHEELEKGTKEQGLVGIAAKAVQKVLEPHFVKEEEFALPPLGLISSLPADVAPDENKEALRMTDKLKIELPQMLKEHKEIVAELERLIEAAKKEGKLEYVLFAEKLTAHALIEEEILYPTAVLVGEFLKTKRGK